MSTLNIDYLTNLKKIINNLEKQLVDLKKIYNELTENTTIIDKSLPNSNIIGELDDSEDTDN